MKEFLTSFLPVAFASSTVILLLWFFRVIGLTQYELLLFLVIFTAGFIFHYQKIIILYKLISTSILELFLIGLSKFKTIQTKHPVIFQKGISVFFFSISLIATLVFIAFSGGSVTSFDQPVSSNLSGQMIRDSDILSGSFTANQNNLGIIYFAFEPNKITSSYIFEFRIREQESENWLHTNTQQLNVINQSEPYLFGLPIQNNSQNRSYYFELELLAVEGQETLKITNIRKPLITRYFYGDNSSIIQFVIQKILGFFWLAEFYDYLKISFFFLPFILYTYFFKYKLLLRKAVSKLSSINVTVFDNNDQSSSRWYYFGLVAVFALAVFFRFYNISVLPFEGDEGLFPILSEQIKMHNIPIFNTGQLYFRGYLFTYLTALSSFILGTSHFSMRFVSAIAGVGFVLLMTSFFKRIHYIYALAVGVYLALYPYLIIWSNQSREYMLSLLLFFWSLFLLHRISLNSVSWTKVVGYASIAFLASSNSIFTYAVLPAAPLYLLVTQRLRWLKNFRLIIVYIAYVVGFIFSYKIWPFFRELYLSNYFPAGEPIIGLFPKTFAAFDYYQSTILNSHLVLILSMIFFALIFLIKQKRQIRIPSFICFLVTVGGTNFLINIFFLSKYSVKYMFSVYIIFGVVLIWFLYYFISKVTTSLKQTFFVLFSILLLHLAASRITTDYASRSYFNRGESGLIQLSKNNSISNYKLYNYFFTNYYSFHGISAAIRSQRTLEAISYLQSRIQTNDIYISTDIYNPWFYKKYDYILNPSLSREMGYVKDFSTSVDYHLQQKYSIYTDTPFIATPNQLLNVLANKQPSQTIWLVADRRLQDHGGDLLPIVYRYFTLEFETAADYSGVHYGRLNTPVQVYSYR